MARSRDELDEVAAEADGRAFAHAADVTDPDAVAAAVSAAREHGDLSICVNSAGLNRPAPTLEQPVADFDLVMNVNVLVTGQILLIDGGWVAW